MTFKTNITSYSVPMLRQVQDFTHGVNVQHGGLRLYHFIITAASGSLLRKLTMFQP